MTTVIHDESQSTTSLNQDDMLLVLKEAHNKSITKKAAQEKIHYDNKMEHIVANMKSTGGDEVVVSLGLRALFLEAMKKDEKEFKLSKLKLKGDKDSPCN